MKVWILERFVPTEETKNSIEQIKEIKANTLDVEVIKICEKLLNSHRETLEKHPNGYWLGYVGKHDYSAFCRNAREFMQQSELVKSGVRVVEAQVEDNARYWAGYKNAVVNEKVTRYLYATYKK